jgi:hypothetical protein
MARPGGSRTARLKPGPRWADPAVVNRLQPRRLSLRALAAREEGIALATALLAMTIAFSIASAAVVFSVETQHGTIRDHNSKEAIAVADAGENVALGRLNQFAGALSGSSPCVGSNSGVLVVTHTEADGWCPQLTGTVGGSTYSYRVGPTTSSCSNTAGATTCIVSIGTSNGVSRRIDVALGASTVGGAFSRAGVVGQDEIKLENNAEVRTSVGTNGNVTLGNGASVCGNIRHGIGKKITFENNSSQCSGYKQMEGNEALPSVSSFMPASISSSNSDYRLVKCTQETPTKVPTGCQEDAYTKQWQSTVPWNPISRTIEPAQNSTLTLTGGDYFICRLLLGNNAHLIMGAGATVRIFFDTPENCGINANEAQIKVENNADITSSGYQPGENKFALPGLYVMGSPSIPTSIVFNNNGGVNEFVLYAPNSNVLINNNATYKGAIAGKTVTLNNHAKVEQDHGFEPPQLGGAKLYTRQSYVECTGGSGSPPDANC